MDDILEGKPKLFIINACRPDEKGTEASSSYEIKDDSFLWQSTVSGGDSPRHVVKGSYFISCLVFVISKNAWKDHIFNIFTKVNTLMEEMIIKDTLDMTASTLISNATKFFYFKV